MNNTHENEIQKQKTPQPAWMKEVIGAAAIGGLICLGAYIIEAQKPPENNAFQVLVDEQVIGVVETIEEVQQVVDEVIKDKQSKEDTDIAINEIVEVKAVYSEEQLLEPTDLSKVVSEALSYEIRATKMIIDEEVEVLVETLEDAEEILRDVARSQLPEGAEVELELVKSQEMLEYPWEEDFKSEQTNSVVASDLEEEKVLIWQHEHTEMLDTFEVTVGQVTVDGETYALESTGNVQREVEDFDFYQQVEIEEVYIMNEPILTHEEALNVLFSNTDEVVYYEMQEGDNIWDLAIENGTTMDRILEINPSIIDVTRMQIGEVIKIEAPDPVLSMIVTQRATFKELIPAEIEYVEFSDLYEDETKVYQEGNDGIKEITVLVQSVDGKEVARELISEEMLVEDKTKVIAFGTMERPVEVKVSSGQVSAVKASPGQFMNPMNGAGTITSHYGPRWGTFHNGMDFGAPSGTPIYAAASGTVTYSGYNSGGYGNMVIIDHGNGYETYYAHNTRNYVNVGQYVNKGENIAAVGSTGYSTGNHLHFEIRYNGSPQNPYNFLY